jgi:hypothetical protein
VKGLTEVFEYSNKLFFLESLRAFFFQNIFHVMLTLLSNFNKKNQTSKLIATIFKNKKKVL